MTISFKNAFWQAFIVLIIFIIGFSLSSGMVLDCAKKISDKYGSDILNRLYHHTLDLEVDSKHYFIRPIGGYTVKLCTEPPSLAIMASLLFNCIFNILFQPVFFCPFTPQVLLNVVLFPFFVYGLIKYFSKVWFMAAIFIIISFQAGIYDSGVEALIRHSMSCELIYLLIGSAGFTGWIIKSL